MKKIWLGIPLLSLLALPVIAQDKQEKEAVPGLGRAESEKRLEREESRHRHEQYGKRPHDEVPARQGPGQHRPVNVPEAEFGNASAALTV